MADTVVNTLYPPLIETFQPAFVYDTYAFISFSLSPFNSSNDIKAIHISVADQRNNSNVLIQNQTIKRNSEILGKIMNGILIAEFPTFDKENDSLQQQGIFQYDSKNNVYAVILDPEWLNKAKDKCWNNNQYYQVQIRFDRNENTNEWKNASDDNTYLLNYREYFSEWSSVTLIKPILEPIIAIAQLTTDQEAIKTTYPGTFHISGYINFIQSTKEGASWPETERLQSYRITALLDEQEIDTTDWIYARPNLLKEENTSIDCLLNLMDTHKNDELIIKVECYTNNGYYFYKNYPLKIEDYDNILNTIRWNIDSSDTKEIDVNQEDGIAKIRFSATFNQSVNYGIIYFRRASSKNNFKTWDLIYQSQYEYTSNVPLEISFDDYSIGSLYQYQYSAQFCAISDTGSEIWDKVYFSKIIYPKFYEMLLMRQNRQIAIRYNGQVSSWKPTINRQKIDTLGGRYPKFVENAIMNYKTYQISGLISTEEDFNRKFLSELEDVNVQNYDIEFNTQYLIRNDTVADGEKYYSTINTKKQVPFSFKYPYIDNDKNADKEAIYLNNPHDSYPHNHWYWEREFREQLVAWLNDGEPKLYRSMPEGNIAVMLTDINLTPDSQLGRMLYNFSATMYEVGDGYSLDELKQLGIINIPTIEPVYITSSSFNLFADNEDDKDLEAPQLIQIKINSEWNNINWVNGSADTYNTGDLWNSLTLKDKLNEMYGRDITQGKTNDIINSSIRLKNITIQFTTPPHYYTYNESTGFAPSINKTININKDIEQETEWLGYVIVITPRNSNIPQQIFINQKGFYHIPDDLAVQNIQILSDINTYQEADVLCECQYKTKPAVEKSTHLTYHLKKIIGQYNKNILPLDINIIDSIYQDHEKLTYQNGILSERIHLTGCKGLMLDVTPYTHIEYIEQKENDSNNSNSISYLTVGSTGIFDAFEDWPLESLKILGRRMVIINPNDTLGEGQITAYPYHIEEWQCYQDIAENINHPKINGIYTKNGIQQIYYIDGNWYPIEMIDGIDDIIIAKVPIYGIINYQGDLEKEIW